MEPLTDARIRSSFVNCTKGEAKRLHVPKDLATRPWDDLDYLGWRDPQSPARGYLVAEVDGHLTGVVLRAPERTVGGARKSLCSLCLTVHSGGGFITADAMLRQPYNEFFKVGISESGNHDQRQYIYARCAGALFEDLTGDYRGATYSSIRMGIAKQWPLLMYRRKHIPTPISQAVANAWLEEEIDRGDMEIPAHSGGLGNTRVPDRRGVDGCQPA